MLLDCPREYLPDDAQSTIRYLPLKSRLFWCSWSCWLSHILQIYIIRYCSIFDSLVKLSKEEMRYSELSRAMKGAFNHSFTRYEGMLANLQDDFFGH